MNKTTILSSFLVIIASFILGGCADDRYLFGNNNIGEGEAIVTAELSFKNFTPALDTRTPGNALNGIENLYIFVYTLDGKLFGDPYVYTSNELEITQNTSVPADSEGVDHTNNDGSLKDDVKTDKAKVKSGFSLPYGKYHIYAAANIRGRYAEDLKNPEVVKTESDLKSYQVEWNLTTISDNDQMFGYFMNLNESASEPTKSKGFGPETVVIDQPNINISAWMRRLASKVTVAYNGEGLNNGVYVYIKNVTIHDIATSCKLGQNNEPRGDSQLLNRRQGNDNNPTADYIPNTNTRITYPKQSSYIYDNSQTGLEIYNGMTTDKGSDHEPNAESLFCYENMQGDYSDQSNKNDFDKRQHGSGKDHVGDNIRQPDGDNDYKDRVPDGTYIEVEAYYVSINSDNPGSGPIKYRFMIGKDITYNYDVERNYHFKVTLGFKGWANQPDWHIDYDIPDPLLDVQPIFRVSYLYHQKSYLPVKIGSDCTKLTVEIVENNWAPTNPNNVNFPSNSEVVSNPETYEFKWNKPAFDLMYYTGVKVPQLNYTYNAAKPFLGFLALNMPDEANIASLPTTIPVKTQGTESKPTNYYSFSDRDDGQTHLKNFYEDNYGKGTQGKSIYEGSDLDVSVEPHIPAGDKYDLNSWMVKAVDDGTDKGNKIVMVPMWTRAKTMIEGSGFSGNNPYEYFVRRATLKVTAEFQDKEPVVDYVTVYQEPRIVNPKAIWRSSGSNGNFRVTLMTAKGSNMKSDYVEITSQGAWTASVEVGDNVSLELSPNSNASLDNGVIYGKTGTNVDFVINIEKDGNAIINVLYHNNNCVHKIFVKQGYENDEELGGKYWSNYSLYSAVNATGQDYNYTGTLTTHPFYLGSYFRRGRITEGILETNNDRFQPFAIPAADALYNITNNTRGKTWTEIGCEDKNDSPDAIGTFQINGRPYKVPELEDFNALKDNCEFALGIIYGSATATATNFTEATGFSSEHTNYGVRGLIAYDAATGKQVLFSLGKYGYGRRNNTYTTYRTTNGTPNMNRLSSGLSGYGVLMYSDVLGLLNNGWSNNNLYRPVPYNLKIHPGVIYWLNNRVADGFLGAQNPGATMSWDVNYFNYDFNSFDNRSEGSHRDALPIKLVRQ